MWPRFARCHRNCSYSDNGGTRAEIPNSFGLIASAANLLLLRRIKELCHSLGGVLSVSIHHDNGIAANGLFNMHKSNGNGSLG